MNNIYKWFDVLKRKTDEVLIKQLRESNVNIRRWLNEVVEILLSFWSDVGKWCGNGWKLLQRGTIIAGLLLTTWSARHIILALVRNGPYASIVDNRLTRALQRALINCTRKDVQRTFYPLNQLLTTKPVRVNDNGHPVSGAVRDAARELITSAVNSIGCVKFEISPAKQSKDGEGYVHQHYAVGDLHSKISDAVPKHNNVVVGIDIDYYLEDPGKYLGYGLPTIFHTFNPIAVAGKDGEATFRIADDTVQYDVSGGSSWKHKVWDWCGYGEFIESDVTMNWFLKKLVNMLGFRKVVYHKVHFARPWEDCPNRALVWCLPMYTCWKFNYIPTDLRARKLQRITFADKVRPSWNALVYQEGKENKLMISLGRQGQDMTVKMDKTHYDVIMGLNSAMSVTSRLLGMGYNDATTLAIIGQYHSGKDLTVGDPARIGRPIGIPKVHWPAEMEADSVEIAARTYASPLVSDENLMPMIQRWEVLSQSLERRVTMVANHRVPNKRIQAYANEWVRLVVPVPGVGVPYSLEETAEMLKKPSQSLAVKQIWDTADMPTRKLIESFVKNEPCMKSPRIISSYADARYMLNFSTFSLAFRDEVLHAEHNKHWFCPGRKPVDIATMVCDYVRATKEPDEGDYENFDGSVPGWAQRNVTNACYMRHFHSRYHKELQGHLDLLITCPARAKRFGFRYESGPGVKSGGLLTCDGNSNLNGFNMYCAVRITMPELTPEQAFQLVGLAFGDDSLFEKVFRKAWIKVVENLGMKLKIENYDPSKGVTFLARVYPDAENTTTSFQDPLRTWRKLHLTSRDPNVPLASAATDRVEGYLVTDKLSPVTSNYCAMVKRVYDDISETIERRQLRQSASKEKPYWLYGEHEGGSWPQDERDYDKMVEVTAARTGLTPEEVRTLSVTLDKCQDPWAPFTVNRDSEINPYKDTLDKESQPVEGAVDVRKFQNDKYLVHLRAIGSATRTTGEACRREDERNRRGSIGMQKHSKRSRSVPGVLEGNSAKGEESDKRPARKTQAEGLSEGTTVRSGSGINRGQVDKASSSNLRTSKKGRTGATAKTGGGSRNGKRRS